MIGLGERSQSQGRAGVVGPQVGLADVAQRDGDAGVPGLKVAFMFES